MRARTIDAAATASGGSRTAATSYIRTGEIRRPDDRRKNKKKDQCVHKKRRNDPFPSIFLSALFRERRIARIYFTSFGVMAITFTPDPRATSIALITSEYLTAGSPLMKMILSGLGS